MARLAFLAVGAVLTLSLPGSAFGQDKAPSKKECAQAYVDAQRLRKADKLSEAKRQLQICASDACPKALTKDCVPWLAEVEANQPSVSLSAVGLDGNATRSVRVSLDGQPLGDELPTEPVLVDPGRHELRFELHGAEPVVLQLEIRRGEKQKPLSADFSKQAAPAPAPVAPEPAPPAPSRPIPTTVWILGGVGVVGLASFAYFGSTGKSEENDLADRCAPNCDPSDVDAAHRKMLIADISLGIGVVALGAATYFYVKRPEKDPASTQVGFAPLQRGGAAFVRGSF